MDKAADYPWLKCKASYSNKKHWRTFDEAYTAYMQSPTSAGGIYDGIGYVFAKDDPYVGGDILLAGNGWTYTH